MRRMRGFTWKGASRAMLSHIIKDLGRCCACGRNCKKQSTQPVVEIDEGFEPLKGFFPPLVVDSGNFWC
ncbi:hypothetical protein QJS10_CPA06g00494 [Acorus calamus]|uniref:Uncharacterized protein n=1 Tax=Acorus calamus TaxID=4465 RepID=A0AAV9EJC5_ACOCL|nr:hypothetical protein QJS10_CPA06g00494 [Acorus calamus]